MWDEETLALGRSYGTATLKEACKGHWEGGPENKRTIVWALKTRRKRSVSKDSAQQRPYREAAK